MNFLHPQPTHSKSQSLDVSNVGGTLHRRRLPHKIAYYVLAAVGYVIAIGLLWQLLISVFHIPQYVLPTPRSVAASLLRLPRYYAGHAFVTAEEAGLGILIGFAAGFVVGIVLRYGGWIGRLLSPLIVGSQVFPKEALAPLFLIYLGFGILPKVVMSALICFFPVAIN